MAISALTLTKVYGLASLSHWLPADADEELNILLNQIYYRSEATARYVAQLTEAAPDGLIILVSDHLMPLRKGINEYKRLGYMHAAQ